MGNVFRKETRNELVRLRAAIIARDDKALLQLIDSGMDVNTVDQEGWTLLHYAAAFNNKTALVKLIESGADACVNNKYGRTALCFSIASNDEEAMVKLIEGGASITVFLERLRLIKQLRFRDTPTPIVEKLCLLAFCFGKLGIKKPDCIYGNQQFLTIWDGHKTKIEEEVEALCQITFDNLSLWDIYKGNDENKLASMSKNKELKMTLADRNFKEKYPLFGDKIQANFLKSLIRAKYLDNALNSVFFYNENKQLNEHCWRNILEYLPQQDLKNTARAIF